MTVVLLILGTAHHCTAEEASGDLWRCLKAMIALPEVTRVNPLFHIEPLKTHVQFQRQEKFQHPGPILPLYHSKDCWAVGMVFEVLFQQMCKW